MNRRRCLGFVALILPVACSSSTPTEPAGDAPYVPPPESCDAVDVGAPRSFSRCSTGSGIFGTWTQDRQGLPAYDYGLDENADSRASFPNTEQLDRRDHVFQFGNARVTAFFANDGYVEVTTEDRGITALNQFDDSQGAFGGGFSWLDDGSATWSSAYKWRPKGAKTTRRFGMGYAESSIDYRGVTLLRRTFAPAGDAPAVLDDVTLTNTTAETKTLRHYEYWDVARRPLEINWVASGKVLSSAPATARRMRDARNGMFDEKMTWDPGLHALEVRRSYVGSDPLPAIDAPNATDYYPGDPMLAIVVGDVARAYTDQASFFGSGDPSAPDAVTSRAEGQSLDAIDGAPRSAMGQPNMFVLRTDLSLAPGASKTLRFAYGYAPMGQDFTIDPAWTDPSRDLQKEASESITSHLMYFASDRNPELHRELAWHSSQMEASVGYRDYFKKHVVPQGSAYLYLHGADGVPRDLMLFALPLVYTHPALAKEQLELVMQLAYADDSRFTYAFQGHGMLDDALGFHSQPSDLDLYFLWALTEYVDATGDVAFLDEPVSYYPVSAANTVTVREHARRAIRHLFDVIGTGEHGLLRIGTGDWNDGITVEAPDRNLAIQKGESVPNSQMALYVLPRAAALLASDAALAQEIESHRALLEAAVKTTLVGDFFGRAYFGDGVLYGTDAIQLEAQVWPLLAPSLLDADTQNHLISRIETDLDDPSPIGATGEAGGQVWPAISELLTWGYTKQDDERAWSHFARSSLASRAHAFPSVWFDIWSGPDGVESSDGQTWSSTVTPMTDFPTANNNTHAMPLLAALKLAGIEATTTGLVLEPHVAGRHFALSTELVDLAQDGATITGTYRWTGGALRSVVVRPRAPIHAASVAGANVAVLPGSTEVTLVVPAGASFSVTSE